MPLRTLIFFITAVLAGCDTAKSPQHSFEVATKGIHASAISNDGEQALVGSIYHGGSLWRVADGERLFNWNHEENTQTTIIASDFSDNDQWALSANPHTMVLWDTKTGKGERFWTAPAKILDVELNADGSMALLGLEDHTAIIFDIRRGGIRRTFKHQNRVRSVDFSKNARLAITGSEDYSARVWDTASGKQLSVIQHGDDVQLVALSDDGKLAFSVSKYDKASIWDSKTGELINELPLKAQYLKRGLRFTSARFNRDNTQLLTGRPDQIVQLWDIDSMQEVARWKLPKRDNWKPTSAAVLDVAFGNNNTVIATASNGFIHQLSLND